MAAEPTPWVRVGDETDTSLVEAHERLSSEEGLRYRGIVLPLDAPSARRLVLVAGFGDTPMATLVCLCGDDGVWSVSRVYVEEGAREVGLGDLLMKTILSMATEAGATRVMGQALPGDRPMKNLFERHGMVAQTIVVSKSLSAPSTPEGASRRMR